MKPKSIATVVASLLCMLTVASCQEADIEGQGVEKAERVSLNLNVVQFEQMPFGGAKASRAKDVKEVCQKLQFAVYNSADELVDTITQKASDAAFGSCSFSLKPGSYRLVVLGHNSSETPVMVNPTGVTFKKDMTDTFYWSKKIKVEKEGSSLDVALKRVVGKFELVTTDNIPKNTESLKLTFSGSCSDIFNVIEGKGRKMNSRVMTVKFSSKDWGKPGKFGIYIFPSASNDSLSVEAQFYDREGMPLKKRTFTVPITRNYITRCSGAFFSNAVKEVMRVSLVDEEWGLNNLAF